MTTAAAITGRTNSLKLDIESGTAQITEADEIQGNIDEIKKKLDDLEKMAAKDKANQKLIGSLLIVNGFKCKSI